MANDGKLPGPARGNVLILGAGTAGALVANVLARKLDPLRWSITIVDAATEHVYQPGLLFLPFRLYGYEAAADICRPIADCLPRSARFVNCAVEAIDTKARIVKTAAGELRYDWLVVALGCRGMAGEVDGLVQAAGAGRAHGFYTVADALKLQEALAPMDRGRLVMNIADMPIKCPVAPIEFVFLADYYFRNKGCRDRIEITLVTPLAGAFTKPVASEILDATARAKGVRVVPDFAIERVEGDQRRIVAFDGKTVDYDLLCIVPPNLGSSVLTEAGLADESGYALTDPRTLKSRKDERVYVVGDIANVATSKAGSVAHFEAETVVENLLLEMAGGKPLPSFDGHANCFVETGFHKAMLLDFNYDIEPLPGKFPLPWIGPLTLLGESHVNHWGKILFEWAYWNLLLPGRLSMMPLLTAKMSFLGKDITKAPQVRRAHATAVSKFMTRDVVTIGSGRPVGEAAALLAKHRIGGLPVVDVDQRLVGVLSESDLLASLDIHGLRRRKRMATVVDELMSVHPVTIAEAASLETAIERMESRRIKRLVVVDSERRVAGILSRGDIVRLFTMK